MNTFTQNTQGSKIRIWFSTKFIFMAIASTLTLSACVNQPIAPGTPITITGALTLKGSVPGAWWAVTDEKGRVWKISAPTPDQLVILDKAQNTRVKVDGVSMDKYLSFEQIKPVTISNP